MKTLFFWLLVAVTGASAQGQQPLHYTLWADGLLNPQLTKSALYSVGAGARVEVSKPIGPTTSRLFAQLGYGHFFQKPTSAFTADIGLINLGYRYQSRKAFMASAGLGAQYWREQMRLRFADGTANETLTSVIPSATVGVGFRVRSRYSLALENRVLFKPETSSVVLRNNVVLSIGYRL